MLHILNYFINFKRSDNTMSISTQGRLHLLNRKSFGHETYPANIYSMCKVFKKNFT